MKLSRIRITVGIMLTSLSVGGFVALTQRSEAQRPQADIKITYKVTMPGGMQSESTTMIKGVRERSETKMGYGMDQVNITQCDLRRTIQLSDKTKKYIITPMEGDSSEASAPAATATTPSGDPSRRGGVITSVMTSTDTGERKEMFGFTARHVKTSIRMESSPDACNPMSQHIERDGWYIDLNLGLNCEAGGGPPMMGRPARPNCVDRFRSRHVGAGRTGFPLIETAIIYDQNDQEQTRMTKEVTDLSRQPLDTALFDVPAGYTQASSTQELYAVNPSDMMQEMMKGRQPAATNENTEMPGAVPADSKRPGTIRVGVVQINNKTDHSVSTDSLRERLIGGIQGSNVEAVPLNATSPSEADAEAKAKQCDFVLYTDISTLKLSAAKKLGGMLGRATGVGSGGAEKTESKVEFKLFPVGDSAPRLQSSASGKEEGDDASAGAAVDTEAKQVSAAVKKRG